MGEELVLLCGMNLPVILGAAHRCGGLAVFCGFGVECCGKMGKNSVICNRGRVIELDKCGDVALGAEHLETLEIRLGNCANTRLATHAGCGTMQVVCDGAKAEGKGVHCCWGRENLGVLVVREWENTIIKQ